jgi:hypothetical protein
VKELEVRPEELRNRKCRLEYDKIRIAAARRNQDRLDHRLVSNNVLQN